MNIFGCPVGVRNVSYILHDQIHKIKHNLRSKSSTKIHFIYFTCDKDYLLLSMSLTSLVTFNYDFIGSITIIEDKKGPLTNDHKESLKKIYNKITFKEFGNIDWASIETLKSELSAFLEISSNVADNDLIAKIDSDVLFFNSHKLAEVCKSDADFIGDGHYSFYKYAQGGLYLMRATTCRTLAGSLRNNELEVAIKECGTNAEDQVIYKLVSKTTSRIWLTRLMLFPNEFENTSLRNYFVKREFCCIHFVHKKNSMKDIYDSIL